jgi:hypothetical protein
MRPRRASVIAMLSLLAWTAMAHAECAWVLWQQLVAKDVHGKIKVPWEPLPGQYGVLHAYRDQAECDAVLARAAATKAQGGDVLVCLPDTVDPRGPKGK